MLSALLLLQVAIPAPTWSGPARPLAGSELAETSALVRAEYPEVLWTLNDSDNAPVLFAIDSMGALLGSVRIQGARNRDWEALAAGRVPDHRGLLPRAPVPRTRDAFLIGDIGDNRRQRPFVVIYQIDPPIAGRDSVITILDSLLVAYPDSARDAESMVVDDRGDIWIVSKELVREPRLYRIPARRWGERGVVKAEFVASLPIPSARGVEHWTTDATWGPDGALVIRTYGALWSVPFRNGRPVAAATRPLCSLVGLGPQGEGVTWLGEDRYAVTSEKLLGTPASITMVRCGR
jgi:hypothetical protein